MHKKIARKGFIDATTAVSIRPGKDDLLLGIIPACSSGKGEDITAVNTQNVLEYCDIAENIIAICADTTVSNTGSKNGAIVILSQVLGQPFI